MRRPTVLGVGNVLLGDEGVGVRAAELLRLRVPSGVGVVDAGSPSPDLLPDIDGASRLLVIDAIDAGRPPGTILRFDGADLPAAARPYVSPHEFGLGDLLANAALHGSAPDEVVVLGVQPARVEPGLELSPEVEAALPRLVEEAVAVLEAWLLQGPSG